MLVQNKVNIRTQYGGYSMLRVTQMPMFLTYVGNYVFRSYCAS